MCQFLLRDLYHNCPTFKAMADNGRIVYRTNYTVNENTPSKWTIDLVVGPRASEPLLHASNIAQGDFSEVWLAIDAKAIMTEHGKARRNRQRDLNSMADILHRMGTVPVTGAYVIINMASQFSSPLRSATTQHRNISRMVGETVLLLQEILKDDKTNRPGLDAIGVTVVDYTNLPQSECTLVTEPPAPSTESPLRYENFLSRICSEFTERFGPK
jgi:hypothetical protein